MNAPCTEGNRSPLPQRSYPRIETERTLLDPWTLNDAPFFAQLNADPVVRRYFYPAVLDAAAAYGALSWIIAHWQRHGFGFFAVRRKSDQALIGGAGLSVMSSDEVSGSLTVEIGWLFAPWSCGRGLATEAANAALDDAWHRPSIEEVVAYMTKSNVRSRRMAERLGMTHAPADDFEDATVPIGHWQRPHVLYRIKRLSI